jgi:hypothetical protein
VAADDVTKALLVEEVAAPRAIAEALFASVTGGVPLLQALIDAGATDVETLTRYLARTEVPFLRQVVPITELVERLPRGLCARLLALPVRQDPVTGTVDVVVADPADPHGAAEIAFHLGAPVRVLRSSLGAIEEALRRLRMLAREDGPHDRFREAAARAAAETSSAWPPRGENPSAEKRHHSLPPAEPALWGAVPDTRDVPPRRGGLVIDTDSAPPPAAAAAPAQRRIRTPPWGTPVHSTRPRGPTDAPSSGYGSEIPIPLTRKTFTVVSGGTQRPPAFVDPRISPLGEGYAFDAASLRDVVEKSGASFIPGPPGLPAATPPVSSPQPPSQPLSFPELTGVLSALRNATSRDDVLELVLIGGRLVALRVALFVVKKGGYSGWVATPEFSERPALQTVLIPLDANSVFDRAVHEDLYLGPIKNDEIHAPLLRIMKSASRDVAAVPIRVGGKTAVIILADELTDTMIGTRRLEELARAAGEGLGRILRTRR